jgi:hypothetical protein
MVVLLDMTYALFAPGASMHDRDTIKLWYLVDYGLSRRGTFGKIARTPQMRLFSSNLPLPLLTYGRQERGWLDN